MDRGWMDGGRMSRWMEGWRELEGRERQLESLGDAHMASLNGG